MMAEHVGLEICKEKQFHLHYYTKKTGQEFNGLSIDVIRNYR